MTIRTATARFLAGAAIPALLLASSAQAALVISTGATQNVTCSGDVCSATAADAILNVTDLTNMLASAPLTIQSGNEAQDIQVEAPFSWTSNNALTLDSYQAVTVDQPVSDAGPAALTITTNDGGKKGELSFGQKGKSSFLSTANSLSINAMAYTLVADIETLANDIAGNPSGNYALASTYDAKTDGVYSSPPVATEFSGSFDGLGNAIQNLSIGISSYGYIGLFIGLDQGGEIRNVVLSNANVSSQDDAGEGALAGFNGGIISGVHATGTVFNPANMLGGLVGFMLPTGSIRHSHAAVSVNFAANGNAAVGGGLVGWNEGEITNSSATGAVSNPGNGGAVGGLVGYHDGKVKSSFATGAVSTQNGFSGGLVGFMYNQKPHKGSVINSYATGKVIDVSGLGYSNGGLIGEGYGIVERSYATGTVQYGRYLGGFFGYVYANHRLAHDYWDTTTSKESDGVGNKPEKPNVTGLTDAQLKSGLPEGFDPAIWAQDPNINNGYPYLIANPPGK